MEKIIYLPKNINTLNLSYILKISSIFGLNISYQNPKKDLFLCWENNYIILKNQKNKIFVDFYNKKLQYRIQRINHEKISKIINKDSLVWDATAGMGTDAFIIANLNLKVHLFETNPLIAVLLQDGINRAHQNKHINNMQLHFTSFEKYYSQTNIKPDIIYLDPMFPNNKKNALSNKNMSFLKYLINIDNDLPKLVNNALKIATRKIIIKRPLKSNFIINKKPNHQYFGKTIRYDVYLPSQN